jgi:hypothetical protein
MGRGYSLDHLRKQLNNRPDKTEMIITYCNDNYIVHKVNDDNIKVSPVYGLTAIDESYTIKNPEIFLFTFWPEEILNTGKLCSN